MRGTKRFEYWKTGDPLFTNIDPETRRRLNALDEEKNQVLHALGIEPDFKSMARIVDAYERALDFLPASKRAAVINLTTEMTGAIQELIHRGNPDLAKDVRRQVEQRLREILTPEEALEYDLRFSQTASNLRGELAGFDPNEQEFVAIFKLRKPFDDAFTHYREYLTGDELLPMNQARKQLDEDLKQLLGNERWDDYQRSRDPEFRKIFKAARRADLPPAEAARVLEVKNSAAQQVRQIRSNQDLSFEQRQEQFESLRRETETMVRQVLGDAGWHEYERSGGAGWLKHFGFHSFPE